MPFGIWSVGRRAAFGFGLTLALCVGAARATPFLIADADSGQVLIQNEATEVWYPASLTKLMTVYVALDAVRAGKLTMDTPLVMSARAASMAPSKMGFRPGTEVTLDNALKMLMVKSPNDVAVMVAEGISGSVEAFAGDMNAAARRLGLQESHFVNPNGLHSPDHVSSARDMAMIARALLREFPERADLYGIGALRLGNQIITNHNGLIGRYPGADGMKTGFTCPAGFNVVATANHSGRHLIVVVLGAPSAKLRTQEAADLFDRGFAMRGGLGSLESLPSSGGDPKNMRVDVCLHRNAAAIAAAEEESVAEAARISSQGRGVVVAAAASGAPYHTEISDERPHFDPVPVFIGPVAGWKGPVLGARPVHAATAALPADAKAYSADANAIDDRASPSVARGEPSAPTVLKGAVRTPLAIRHHPKPAKHVVASKEPEKPATKAAARAKDPKAAKPKTVKTEPKAGSSD
ncbi:MAG TPA: D-alanyl-D-alanine carboxypeptidase family protein [Roseiarcus sp.]|nr:D-alanyl-D-alanine carboxypeptidase family protein [Roseiarcus sp.]